MALELVNINSETLESASVRYRCLVSERLTLMRQLKGGMIGSGGSASHIPPATYSENPNLVVKQVTAKPVGETWASPEYCWLDCEYGLPDPIDWPTGQGGENETAKFDISIKAAADGLKLPKNKGLKWADDASMSIAGQPVGEDIADAYLWTPVTEITCKCDHFRYLKPKTIGEKLSCVNAIALTLFGELVASEQYAAESVLFVSRGGDRKWTPDGYSFATRELTFHCRKESWNKVYNPELGSWEPVTTNAGTKLFPTTDFSILFTG